MLQDLYLRNNLSIQDYEEARSFLLSFSEFLKNERGLDDIDGIRDDDLALFVNEMVRRKINTIENFVVLLRYYQVTGQNEHLIVLYKYLGTLDVMENIIERLTRIHGDAKAKEVLFGWEIPPLGTSPKALTIALDELMNRLTSYFDESKIKAILAGNNHGISEKSILPDKIAYEAATSLEVFLKEDHERKVKVLEEHWLHNKVWFEQKITEEVVEFARSNQEILSAVLKDDYLYLTKIPYDPDGFLKATDLEEKRYLACHCPFAREAVKSKKPISPLWCYCSGGFTKYPYEIILEQKLDIEILESVLEGSTRCRFRIPLNNIEYKK